MYWIHLQPTQFCIAINIYVVNFRRENPFLHIGGIEQINGNYDENKKKIL